MPSRLIAMREVQTWCFATVTLDPGHPSSNYGLARVAGLANAQSAQTRKPSAAGTTTMSRTGKYGLETPAASWLHRFVAPGLRFLEVQVLTSSHQNDLMETKHQIDEPGEARSTRQRYDPGKDHVEDRFPLGLSGGHSDSE